MFRRVNKNRDNELLQEGIGERGGEYRDYIYLQNNLAEAKRGIPTNVLP